MKTRYIIGAIILCMGISLYIRIIFPYEGVFGSEWIKFTSIDAYWQMAQVDKIAPAFPTYLTQIFNIPFFIWLLSGVAWCIGGGSPSQHIIDTVGVYFPVILAGITIIPVYFIGKTMFGRMAGLIAAALIAVLPGEWLGRSLLGFTDHHVMEVLLSATTIMFLVMALKAGGRRRIIHTLFMGFFMGICLLTTLAGALFVGIIAVYLLVQITINLTNHQLDKYPIWLLSGGVGVTLVLYLADPHIVREFLNMAKALDKSGLQAITTMELQPFTSPGLAWASFGWAMLIIPPAIGILIYKAVKTGHPGAILLVIWSIVTLILMLEYRRFAYYFAVNVSLLTGWFIWYMWQRLRNNTKVLAVLVTIILITMMIVPNALNAIETAKRYTFTPPDGWYEALEWVRDNTPEDSTIVAWWDYGYWIEHIAQRKASANPSQDPVRITNTAKMLISGEGIDADYIIIDYATVVNKYWSVISWAGLSVGDFSSVTDGLNARYYQSFAVRLFTNEAAGDYDLVYSSDGNEMQTVMVFEYVGVKE